jgi:DUF3048 family protein
VGGRPVAGKRHSLALVVTMALVGTGCGVDILFVRTIGPKPELVTTTTSTTAPPTTTTTIARPKPPPAPRPKPPPKPVKAPPPPPPPPPPLQAPGSSPLTGVGGGGSQAGHPALVVKIDNVRKAWPQAGINEADVVFEEGVEGGITRFAAVFHSRQADPVGPVRSARSTDVGIVSAFNRPLFSYSGANDVFKEYVRKAPLVDVGVENFPGRYYRESRRPSPNNLFSHTSKLFELAAPDATGPPALFAYRPAGQRPRGADMKAVSRAQAEWRSKKRTVTTAIYDWDSGNKSWLRIQNGELHVDSSGRRVGPANVIFQFVKYRDTGLVDSSGAEVPEAQVVGEGDAWVLTGGYLVPAHWSKPSAEVVTRYTDASGADVRLAPGQTWVELVPPGNGTFTERTPDAPTPGEPEPTPEPQPQPQPQPQPEPQPKPEPNPEPQPTPPPQPLPPGPQPPPDPLPGPAPPKPP